MDMHTSDCIVAYFDKLLKFYRDFSALEQNKYGILAQGTLDRLDDCMKKEQAYVLKARGLEQERISLMEQTPRPKAAFREMIPLFPSEHQEKLQSLYEELSSVLLEIKELNRKSNQIAEQKLHTATTLIDKIKEQPELQKIYSEKARNKNQSPVFLSTKI